MRKWLGILIIVCMLFSGCGAKDKEQETENVYYEVTQYTLPYSKSYTPVVVGKNIYYLDEREENIYALGKLNLSTGEIDERELDFSGIWCMVSFAVDREENSYHLVTIEEGDRIWNVYLIKCGSNGELIYKQPYSREILNAVGKFWEVKVKEEEVSISGPEGKIVVDEQGEIQSVHQGEEKREEIIAAFQGTVYHINENGKEAARYEKMFDLIDYGIEQDLLYNVVL